jgi:hypothetical protein
MQTHAKVFFQSESEALASLDLILSTVCKQVSILKISISPKKFFGDFFILEFWTHFQTNIASKDDPKIMD